MKVYFDNAATTPVHPKVLEKMLPYYNELFGNPSSIHSFGRKARVAIEEARETVAGFIGASASEIYFTSSGTEAINFAILGMAKSNFIDTGKNKIVTSNSEHYAVIESFKSLEQQRFTSNVISSTSDGKVNESEYITNVQESSLISLMHVNNVLGSINDIKQLAEIAHQNNALFHTDAVQSFGKFKIDVNNLGVDSLCASGHKINGPKGIGMVYVRSETPISPLLLGGSQERNRRGGTENVAGIIGFAEAVNQLKDNIDDKYKYVSNLKNRFINGLTSIDRNGIIVNSKENSSPFVLSITFHEDYYNNDPEAMLMYLDINGVAASGGAACTSGTLKPSHAILAIGHSVLSASGTIRFSFGSENNENEVDYTLDVLTKMSAKFRK
jgi:cysteine desulfurase